MNDTITTVVNEIIRSKTEKEDKLARAEKAIKEAKEALKEARRQRRIAKGTLKNIDWKQSAENMAKLLNELPAGTKFTPTQLANIYALAYPTDKDFGLLHIRCINPKTRHCHIYGGYIVVGLEQDDKGNYYRAQTAEVLKL